MPATCKRGVDICDISPVVEEGPGEICADTDDIIGAGSGIAERVRPYGDVVAASRI